MDSLSIMLQAAASGGRQEICAFLTTLKDSRLIVPEKDQLPVIKNLANYPNRPLNLLAVTDGGVTYVPIFSCLQLCNEWSGTNLKTREINCLDLIRLLPEDWWLALNPGSELRKDFSPWELARLPGGDDEINEIATEIEADYGISVLQIRPLSENEIPGLEQMVRDYFESNQNIRAVHLGLEEGETLEGSPAGTLLIGLKLKDLLPAELSAFRNQVRDLISPLLIGSVGLKVLLGVGFSDLELGVFADFRPFLQR